jgi:hypothetical protein
LVLALRDYFSERLLATSAEERTLAAIKNIASSSSTETDSKKLEEIAQIVDESASEAKETGDRWTLEFISIYRIQPLIEALDDDVSSFVTVAEVNAFTAARPEGWS